MNLTPEQLDYLSLMPTDEAELKELQARHRQIIAENREKEKQRKARNHRLIEHGAILEHYFPETAQMDSTAFANFISGLTGKSE